MSVGLILALTFEAIFFISLPFVSFPLVFRLTMHILWKQNISQSWRNYPMLLPLNAKPSRRCTNWHAKKKRQTNDVRRRER